MENTQDNIIKQETVTVIAPFEAITKTLDSMVEVKIVDYWNYNLKDTVESIIDDHNFNDELESAIDDYDFDDKISSALDNYDFSDTIESALDIDDIASKVKDYIDTPDANEMAYDLLTSFNIDNNCKTGELFVNAVEIIIERYNYKLKQIDIHNHPIVSEEKDTTLYSRKDIEYVLRNTLSIGDAHIEYITSELKRLAKG